MRRIRLLHTSDWHLGRAIRGHSRTDEFEAVIAEVVAIAVDQRVDAILLAGDIFDHRSPPTDAEALFIDAVVRLADAKIPLVAIAGNHDSAQRLAAWQPLMGRLSVRLVPHVAPPESGTGIEIVAASGARAIVACVPFVPERRFGSAAALFDAPERWYASYAGGMGELLAAMTSCFRSDTVNVLLAHLFTDGALLGKGEREATIGIDYAVAPSRLPSEASYIALGHVHRPQAVAGAGATARYAGSLLQLDFGEAEQQKSVTIIEASAGTPPRVTELALSAGRALRDIRGSLEQLGKDRESFGEAYLRVFLEVDGPSPGLSERVREMLPNALDVRLVYERDDRQVEVARRTSMSPREQFAAYHLQTQGSPAGSALLTAFDEVLAVVEDAG